ncbi:MAG: hypothetical protein CHACPFDD_03034 [Phycisphaerae bacterium]|nr:hypothetical protein [Phycisphaerae bacterium]
MRWLIINTDYPRFLVRLYADPALADQPFHRQMQTRFDTLFGLNDFYSRSLRALGHEATDLIINNRYTQSAWAHEHNVNVDWPAHELALAAGPARTAAPRAPRPFLPTARQASADEQQPFFDILTQQVRTLQPDVLVDLCPEWLTPALLRALRPHVRLIIGQHPATPLSDVDCWLEHDLVVSSFPPTVDALRHRGVPAERLRLAFDPAVLDNLTPRPAADLVFVGSFFGVHRSRVAWLETLCRRFESLDVWSPDAHRLPPDSPIHARHRGEAWGRDMYSLLRSARIALNHHGDIPPFANNLRLFEATGVGALLLTDWKENLGQMFDVGREVAAFHDTQECAAQIEHFLGDEPHRAAVAAAGQIRTLREHTWQHRMRDLVTLAERYL